jgi:hypothetical protein
LLTASSWIAKTLVRRLTILLNAVVRLMPTAHHDNFHVASFATSSPYCLSKRGSFSYVLHITFLAALGVFNSFTAVWVTVKKDLID